MKKQKGLGKRKIALICLGAILLFLACQIFSVFFWQVKIAEKELSKYAKEILKIDEEIACEYDWYNDRYIAINNLGFTLDYRRKNKTIHDGSFNLREMEKVNQDYKDLIMAMPDNLTLPKNIYLWTEVSASDYQIKAQRLYLLGIYNNEAILEEESLLMPAKITMEIIASLGKEYNFTGIQVTYFDKNGGLEIAFPADTFEEITLEKLVATTKVISTEQSEDYAKWLEENGFL